ncbi:abortive infection system antitoxin AbiGi family protein [Aeromonas media]|uniref:abortive infection system antitoxin AbiGi family protein n=1 Tax=Aeromonas media TaxID=651 RepID=UPI001396A7AD|nr:abortive infection system antitoxin AbiGi family protein [Aeromonas media]
MALSSNTLIHFTDDIIKLKKIVEDGFKVYNCKESIVLGGKATIYHAPMVSFCDIPLSEIKEHISKYGSYGLGMTKEWAIKKGLNPVLYLSANSTLSANYRTAFNHFNAQDDDDVDIWSNEQKSLADVLRYIKNYEADLIRNNIEIKNYRFSDEREWRYVPDISEKCDMIMGGDWYADSKNKKDADEKLSDLRLDFDPCDIKYIIIRDDSEIGNLIDHLRRAKGDSYSLHDIERLTTRILTADQIKGDI